MAILGRQRQKGGWFNAFVVWTSLEPEPARLCPCLTGRGLLPFQPQHLGLHLRLPPLLSLIHIPRTLPLLDFTLHQFTTEPILSLRLPLPSFSPHPQPPACILCFWADPGLQDKVKPHPPRGSSLDVSACHNA